jgi:tetratricopeptide (TPR) repeat protein
MRHFSAIAAIAFCLALAPQTSAQADSPESTESGAEEHSRRGVKFYADGKLPEAVREMLKAYELAPESGLLYNIARIYQKMGQRDLAIHYLKEFVTQPGADPDTVQKALQHLEALKQAPATSMPRVASPSPAPKPDSPPPEPKPAPKPEPPLEPAKPVPAPPPVESSSIDLLGWITLGTGGATLIAAGVLGGLALSADGVLNDPSAGLEDKRAAQQEVEDYGLGADICIGVGVAAAAAGLVMLLVNMGEDAPAVALAPTIDPGRAGLQLLVRFP